MDTGFSSYYPLAQLIYFVSVLSVTMFIMNPLFLIISFICASVYILYSFGISRLLHMLSLTIITSIMIIIINPLISHKGITKLFILPDGNAMTMEALIFGIGAAIMLSAVMAWFYSINRIFTSDRVIWVFGRISPKLGLFLSMTMNFIGKFRIRLKQVRAALYPLGRDISSGKKTKRLRNGIRILSIMIQWSLENSVDTADSMKSRGYGTAKRTFYSVFRPRARDIIVIIFSIIISAGIFVLHKSGAADYSYYPYFELVINSAADILCFVSYLILCLMPLIIDFREDCHWKYIRSGI